MDSKASTILVTGAAGGLGSQVVRLLRARGANVVCVDKDAAALDRIVAAGKKEPGESFAAAADLGSPEDVQRVFDAAVNRYGKLDGVFLGAAINGKEGLIVDTSNDTFDHVIRTNLKSVWLCIKSTLPIMLKQGGGSIVTVGSVASMRGAVWLGAYAASKHAVLGLTRTVALEYAKQGIRANTLCPGTMETPLVESMLKMRGDGDREKGLAVARAGIPNGRLAQPEELAITGVWLLLDAPAHLNGQDICVDGGRTAG